MHPSPETVAVIVVTSLVGIVAICWIYWPEVKEDLAMIRNWLRSA